MIIPVFIELSQGESKLWLNASQIAGIFRHNGTTTIVTDAREFMIKESPDQVAELIEKATKQMIRFYTLALARNLEGTKIRVN